MKLIPLPADGRGLDLISVVAALLRGGSSDIAEAGLRPSVALLLLVLILLLLLLLLLLLPSMAEPVRQTERRHETISVQFCEKKGQTLARQGTLVSLVVTVQQVCFFSVCLSLSLSFSLLAVVQGKKSVKNGDGSFRALFQFCRRERGRGGQWEEGGDPSSELLLLFFSILLSPRKKKTVANANLHKRALGGAEGDRKIPVQGCRPNVALAFLPYGVGNTTSWVCQPVATHKDLTERERTYCNYS